MGFNKKHITRDMIISTIKGGHDVRRLLKADVFIMDSWSLLFFKNYDISDSYNQNRDKIKGDIKILSDLKNISKHENFKKLRKLSNILENLIKNPSWIEILLARTYNLGKIPEEFSSDFNKLVEFYINSIINLYKIESRNKIIDDIINESK